MPTKEGNGGHGQEKYDPSTGRYISNEQKIANSMGVEPEKKLALTQYSEEYELLKKSKINIEQCSFFEEQEKLSNLAKKGENTLEKLSSEQLEERAKQISYEFFKKNGDGDYDYICDIVIGLPGSGKSTISKQIEKKSKCITLDSDDLKKMTPEFKRGENASSINAECGMIMDDKLLPRFLKNGDKQGQHLIIQRVGGKNPDELLDYLSDLKDAGYKVNLHMCDVDPKECKRRIAMRFIETGRYVPMSYFNTLDVEKTFNGIKDYFDSSYVLDNNKWRE